WLEQERPWREVLEVFLAAGRGLLAAHEAGLVHRDFKPANVLLGRGGRVFLAMELVEGVSLRRWLEAKRSGVRETLRLFAAAGEGLGAAHAAGLVHRDFKPDNVVVSPGGRVRVGDFGLAQPAPAAPGSAEASESVARAGGTPGYMAPEQWEGLAADAKSDQFSFCVALYEALYVVRPFGATGYVGPGAALRLGGALTFPATPRVPAGVRKAIARGLALDPAARHPSMAALVRELGERRARWLWAALPAAAIGAAASALVVRASLRHAGCDGGEAEVGEAWGGGRREAVRRAFLATGSPSAEAAFRAAERALDRYAGEWVAARNELCTAERRGAEAPSLLAQRASCLERRRLDLEVLTAELTRVDARVL
ncbi:MAG TPA: protein kinase, partial [Polyangiaceae bacterium]|nr:protein kinase [Polyangiaceae bacterium]